MFCFLLSLTFVGLIPLARSLSPFFPALGSEHINPQDPMGILALTSNRRCYYTPAIYHVL